MAPKKFSARGKKAEKEATIADRWMKSKLSEAQISSLVDDCLLQPKEIIQWQSAEGDARPFEKVQEVVLFKAFVERGLAIPACDFLHGLIFYWGVQLHHLTPQFHPSSCYLRATVRSFPWNLSPFRSVQMTIHSKSLSQ